MSITAPREVIQTQIATHNAASPVGAEIMAGRARGSGEAVMVSTAAADITDALEELGMAASNRAKVDLDKVKVRKGAGTDLDALGRIADYLDKLPNLPKDQALRDLVAKFNKFEEYFRRGATGDDLPSADDLRALLAEYDGDIAHRFAALETVRDVAATSGAPAAYLALLDELRAEMRQPDLARDIAAGFAAAPEAAHAAEGLGATPQDYRDSYRAMLRDTPDAGRIFAALRDFSLTEKLEAVLDSFIRVAGDDMASFGPSTEPAQLGGVLTELSRLKQMRTVLDASTEAIGKIDRMFGADDARPDATDLAGRVLGFAGAPVASLQGARGLIDGFGPEPADLPVAAVNLVRDLHAAMPDALLPDGQREPQARVLLTLSDQVVEQEEASYGA
ncbi:HrpJ domain-containing protein [Marivita sp. S0852]|uniref:HrpJ domain-containing protein n=1 Tax=Marivita sp. S0852 TaxID=3373893 RepID=UPI003981DA37